MYSCRCSESQTTASALGDTKVCDLQCTLSYLAIPRVLTAPRVAYGRVTVLYVAIMPTGGTFLSILVALHSVLSHLDRPIRHHTTLADVLCRS